MNKKGFTLIELLAVIVILAIIALIATPTILGVIDKARKGAAESSAYGFIDAVEKNQLISELENGNNLANGVYNDISDFSNVTIKGEGPKKVSVCLANGQISSAMFEFNNYNVKYDGQTAKVVEEFSEVDCNESKIEEVVTNYTAEQIESDENLFSMGANDSVVGKYDPETKNLTVTKNGNSGDYSIKNSYPTELSEKFGYNGMETGTDFINEIIIEEGVKKINSGAFESIRINKIAIPASVAVIEERAFYRNDKLEEISIAKLNKNYKVVDGVLYSKDNSVLLAYPKSKIDTSYTILDGTKKLGEVSFGEAGNLKDLYIPNSVSEVDEFAFWGMNDEFHIHYCGSLNLNQITAFNLTNITCEQ